MTYTFPASSISDDTDSDSDWTASNDHHLEAHSANGDGFETYSSPASSDDLETYLASGDDLETSSSPASGEELAVDPGLDSEPEMSPSGMTIPSKWTLKSLVTIIAPSFPQCYNPIL